jgi:hypothetical protein
MSHRLRSQTWQDFVGHLVYATVTLHTRQKHFHASWRILKRMFKRKKQNEKPHTNALAQHNNVPGSYQNIQRAADYIPLFSFTFNFVSLFIILIACCFPPFTLYIYTFVNFTSVLLRTLCNPKARYCIHNSPSLIPVLSRINPLNMLQYNSL